MQIIEERVDSVLTVALKGRLDATSSNAVEDRLLGLIQAGDVRVVVDLERLDYISSVGLRVLMLAAKRLKTANGAIVVCALQPTVQQVFEIAGFTSIFRVFPTRESAVAAVA